MNRDSLILYLSTLQGILDLINTTPQVSIKKIRKLLEAEIETIRGQFKRSIENGQDEGRSLDQQDGNEKRRIA